MVSTDLNSAFSIAACAMSAIALYAVFVLYKAMAHWRARCLALEGGLPSLRREVEMIASLHGRTGKQVSKIAQDCADLQDRVERVEQRGTARAVGEAVGCARRGGDVARLTQQFGLSRGEAELVSRLHGQRHSA